MTQVDLHIQQDTPRSLRLVAGGRRCCVDLGVAHVMGIGVDATALRRLLADLLQRPATDEVTLKHDQRSLVLHLWAGGRQWIVKHIHKPWYKTCLYQMVHRTPVWREWYGARRLKRVGLRCSAPLAVTHPRGANGHPQALVLPYVEATPLDEVLRNAEVLGQSPTQQRQLRDQLAMSVGRQIGRMVGAGIVNRDHKASNLLMDDVCRNGGEPVIIDPAGLRRRRSDTHVCRMLATLLRNALEHGRVTQREQLRCLRAILRVDATFVATPRRRLRAAVACVRQQYQALH